MELSKRVIVVGGTGFLGYHAVNELLASSWEVTALGLPLAQSVDLYPSTVRVVLKNLNDTSDEDLMDLLQGQEALVFAAGVDDRVAPQKPAYPFFQKANVQACVRVLRLAKQAGIKRAVVLGSYFAHFERLWPHLKLVERHPYIRSRVEQETAVTSIPGLEVVVLELPYIFGGMPIHGWKSLWEPLIKYIRFTSTVLYMKGGSACISAKAVGQAIVGALEHGEPGTCYPISDENLTWSALLTRLAAADGHQIRVVRLPDWIIKIGLYGLWLIHGLLGREAGLDPRYFAALQTAETFIDSKSSQEALAYKTGGLDQAFRDTVYTRKGVST
jgi:nucleoside-diphosphate-sugar epimerase